MEMRSPPRVGGWCTAVGRLRPLPTYGAVAPRVVAPFSNVHKMAKQGSKGAITLHGGSNSSVHVTMDRARQELHTENVGDACLLAAYLLSTSSKISLMRWMGSLNETRKAWRMIDRVQREQDDVQAGDPRLTFQTLCKHNPADCSP